MRRGLFVITIFAAACGGTEDAPLEPPKARDAGTAVRDAGAVVVRDGGGSSVRDGGTVTRDGGTAGRDGGTAAARPSRIGIFSPQNNYFELDAEGGVLRFHFGAGNSRWGLFMWPVAGDFDGDERDTVALFDPTLDQFWIADENDSDEHAPRGVIIDLTAVPDPPPAGESIAEIPVAGDWNGDGTDGFGVFHPGTGTYYLRETATSGDPERTVTFSEADGYPRGAWPIVGDFDGDGDDDLGVYFAGTAYLPNGNVSIGTGQALAGDWNGDGVDTIVTFTGATNTFELPSGSRVFGHAERQYWTWAPIVGDWQVPTAPVASDGYEWTTGAPGDHGFAPARFTAALDDAAAITNLQSVLVVRDGTLVGERYHHGYARHIAGNVKSVSKSVLSAVYGAAMRRGVFTGTDETVATYLPTYFTEPEKQTITLEDLLTMRGGLEWSEGPNYVGGMIQSADFVAFVTGQRLVTTPGTTYRYSTGLTHVASAALTAATGEPTRDYARREVFEPLGITVPRWDRGREGNFVGGAEMWLRPRDMARFGQLYLDGGSPVLTPEWVTASVNPWIPEAGGRNYGLWWRERPWRNYPFDDSYFAWGHGGQFVFVFPSWDLIVVVTSRWNVDQTVSGQVSGAIFGYVDNQILTAVRRTDG